MLKAWTEKKGRYELCDMLVATGIKTVEELINIIDAKLPAKLFGSDYLDAHVVDRVCEAYWPRVLKLLEKYSKIENWYVPVDVLTIEQFKNETLDCIKAGVWKLKHDTLSSEDEGVIQYRLATLKEAIRLTSKFAEVYIRRDGIGREIQNMDLRHIVPFDTKGEKVERILLGEDQVWFIKSTYVRGYRRWIIFGDANIPKALDYEVDIKYDKDGHFYIFALDDLRELLGPEVEKIKALVGK
jgi:hypothetical protein